MSDTNLFLQYGDSRKMANIKGRKIILSTEEVLRLDECGPGEGTEFEWYVYAERLACPEGFHVKNGLFAVNGFLGNELSLSADGECGTMGWEFTGKTTVSQLEGSAGGNLTLYLEQWEDIQTIRMTANGGNGGNGRNASRIYSGLNGEAGGNGGAGGSVCLRYWHWYFELINEIKEVYQLKDQQERSRRLKKLIQWNRDRPTLTAFLDMLEKKQSFTDQDLVEAGQFFSLLGENWGARFWGQSKGGWGGIGGSGSVFGPSGNAGVNRKPDIQCITPSSWISFLRGQKLMYAHPDQCEMLLRKIRLRYFALDSIEHQEEVSRLSQMLLRLMRRTEPFYQIPSECPLAQAYQEEWKIGARNSLERLEAIYREASALRWNLQQGLDYMGRQTNYVPLLSYTTYEKNFLEIAAHMSAIEDLRSRYFEAVSQEKRQAECHWNMNRELVSIENQAKEDIEDLVGRLHDLQISIALQESKGARLKPEVIRLMEKYKEAVKEASGFNLYKIFSSLTLIALVPKSPIMQALSDAEILEDGAKSLADSIGDYIQRDYLIDELEQVSLSLEKLNEGFTIDDDGKLNLADPGGKMLLAEQDEWKSVLEKLGQKLSDQSLELKEKAEEFVETILTRNNYVLEYNQVVGLIRKKYSEKVDARCRMKLLEDQRFQELCAQYPAEHGMMESVYQHARIALLDAYHLAAKSYGFWCLQSGRELLTDIFGPNGFQEISKAALESAIVNLKDKRQKAIAKGAEMQEVSRLVSIPLSKSQISDLQNMGMTVVHVSPNSFKNGNIDNPFAGMYDIRVRSVKVFLEGLRFLEEGRQVRTTITQSGEDRYMDRSGNWHSYSHESRTTIFEYDADTNVENLSGTLGGFSENQEVQYALVGPFSMWRITILQEANRGMDYSNLTAGYLKFQICCRSY